MIFKRRTIDNLKTEATTVITTGVQLTGTIKGTADVILHGGLEGDVRLSGMLLLGKSGKIRGKIDARNVVIEGDVEGIIKATEKVEIRDGGKVKGDIFTATIAVSENAYFEGNVKMEVEDREPSVLHFTEKRRSQSEPEGALPQ
jgi:cytoskeletal protein CcmA (bactofilin family)